MSSPGTAHYLKPAGKASTPPVAMFLDSETATVRVGQLETEVLRNWRLRADFRRDKRREGETWQCGGTTGEGAAAAVDAWAGRCENAWLYAHNVTFDMVTTNLAAGLARLGWVLSARFGMTKGSMWCVLHKGRRVTERSDRTRADGTPEQRVRWSHTLTICDSFSLFPAALAELAPLTGIVKPQLPEADESLTAWDTRCGADTDILADLVLALMCWWDANDVGPWSVSGAGLGWQTYRRTLTPRQMVIDHDPGVLEFERSAVYGGRRDAFRLGDLPKGKYGEIDYTAAYPTIAAECNLPSRIACPVNDDHRRQALRGRVPLGMLAEVTIRTSVPRWPLRSLGRVFYPVGEFRTVLAAPDIQAAADAGALAAVHDGWLYVMTGHLRPWARQVLTWAKMPDGKGPGVLKVAARLWSRAVIGKFAQRGWRTEPWVGEESDTWSVEEIIHLSKGTIGTITGLAGTYWLSWADQRGEHERPAVLAFVESHVRARLGKVISGPYGDAILQCDTDGIMVSHVRLRELAARTGVKWDHGCQVPLSTADVLAYWNEVSYPLVMRDKTLFAKVVMYGPQHAVLDGKPRFAGVPKGAWQTGPGTWAARLWPGMSWQASHGGPAGYDRPIQPYKVIGPYAAGWVLENGTVRPVQAAMGADGTSAVLHWKLTDWAASGDVLGPRQASWAAGLWEGNQA